MDNCDAAVEIVFSDAIVPGSTANDYTIVRTYTATDHCGNASSATQTLTVEDTQAPELVSGVTSLTMGPEDWQVFDFGYWEPLVLDNCDATTGGGGAGVTEEAGTGIPATYTVTILPGSCVGTFEAQVVYTHSDVSGNSLEVLLVVQIIDASAPEFTVLPEDLVLECGTEIPMAAIAAVDHGSSPADIVYSMTESTASGSCANNATITRTWMATDACGNAAIHTQTIELIDTTAPVFTVFPSNQSAECAEQAYAYEAVDNCGAVTITFEDNSHTLRNMDSFRSFCLTLQASPTSFRSMPLMTSRSYSMSIFTLCNVQQVRAQ